MTAVGEASGLQPAGQTGRPVDGSIRAGESLDPSSRRWFDAATAVRDALP
jgi:hypothetical protein